MRAQSWSMDLVIAILVFTAIIALFFTYLSASQEKDAKRLESSARSIQAKLDADAQASSIPLVKKNDIDPFVLASLYSQDYNEIRQSLGTNTQFCIFLETQDGRILPIDVNGQPVDSIGNGNVTINGHPCGERP